MCLITVLNELDHFIKVFKDNALAITWNNKININILTQPVSIMYDIRNLLLLKYAYIKLTIQEEICYNEVQWAIDIAPDFTC